MTCPHRLPALDSLDSLLALMVPGIRPGCSFFKCRRLLSNGDRSSPRVAERKEVTMPESEIALFVHRCTVPTHGHHVFTGTMPNISDIPKIEDLEECRNYINLIDFTMAKNKMRSEEGDLDWSQEKADVVEDLYRKFLFLKRKYAFDLIPPPADVDRFWHFHILDTLAYHGDCQAIFGGYLHHYPYFGMRGPDDERALISAFETTKRLYSDEFGIDLDNL